MTHISKAELLLAQRCQQRLQQERAIGGTEAGAGVPAGAGGVATVIAAGDIAQGFALAELRVMLVEVRVQEADSLAAFLIEQRDQASPQRSYGAGATNRHALAIEVDL